MVKVQPVSELSNGREIFNGWIGKARKKKKDRYLMYKLAKWWERYLTIELSKGRERLNGWIDRKEIHSVAELAKERERLNGWISKGVRDNLINELARRKRYI